MAHTGEQDIYIERDPPLIVFVDISNFKIVCFAFDNKIPNNTAV